MIPDLFTNKSRTIHRTKTEERETQQESFLFYGISRYTWHISKEREHPNSNASQSKSRSDRNPRRFKKGISSSNLKAAAPKAAPKAPTEANPNQTQIPNPNRTEPNETRIRHKDPNYAVLKYTIHTM